MMMFLSLFGMLGCSSKAKIEQAEKKILAALHEKYGKEFELKLIGGGWGTMNNNTWKAVVKPKDDSTINVRVEITKDMKHVYDNYLNQAVARTAEIQISELASRVWGKSRVNITNDTGLTYTEHTDTNMSYEQFLELYPMNILIVTVYLDIDEHVNNRGDMDQDNEIKNYEKFSKMLIESNYMRSSVGVWYITPVALSHFDEARNSDDRIYKYYKNEEEELGILNLVTGIRYEHNDQGNILTTKEEFDKKFNTWKEERMRRIE